MSENPYASPNIQTPPPYSQTRVGLGLVYKPLPGLLLANRVLAIVSTIGSVALALLAAIAMGASSELSSTEFETDLTALDIVTGLVALAYLPIIFAWNICFLIAVYRLAANSHAIGVRRPETSPGFAVGSYFIPILNLFKPYQVMKEFYDVCRAKTGSLLGLWWAAHIISAILTQISFRLAMANMRDGVGNTESLSNMSTLIDLIDIPFSISLAVFSQLVLTRLAARQDELASQMPTESAWTPAMIQAPKKPLSNWGGD
jgi:Domain of unknown function (DUF4328)